MVRLNALLLGYRTVNVDSGDTEKMINILLKLDIPCDLRQGGEFIIRERDAKRLFAYCRGRIRYSASEARGFPASVLSLKKRKGFLLAAILFTVLHLTLSALVWDIRIEGAENVSEGEIVEELSKAGFGVGIGWKTVDKNAVEASFLAGFPQVSWISINRRGTVAYVRVVEAENIGNNEAEAPEYSSIVADRDAVIEEITVFSGSAAVKVGDVVKKGDVLISGIVETEAGTLFCRAEGSVIGQSVSVISAEIPKDGVEKIYRDRQIFEIQLKIFNFSVNIFKNYRICLNDYDIINDERGYTFLGKSKLPITLVRTYRSEYTEENVTYEDSTVVQMATDELNEAVRSRFAECDVIKMRSFGKWNSDSYVLSSEVVYLTDIGLEKAMEVS